MISTEDYSIDHLTLPVNSIPPLELYEQDFVDFQKRIYPSVSNPDVESSAFIHIRRGLLTYPVVLL